MAAQVEKEYRDVVFRDQTSGDQFIIKSTVETDQTTTVDGKEYPLHEVEVSSSSHPFYTGEQKFVDTEGRVERFERKYGKMKQEDETEGEE